jgi:hypothetical protein
MVARACCESAELAATSESRVVDADHQEVADLVADAVTVEDRDVGRGPPSPGRSGRR